MVVSMSEAEFSRLNVLLDVHAKRLTVAEAASVLQLHRRQVFRLLRGLRQYGAASLASKRRGKPSNSRVPAAVRELTMSLVKAHYADFGPTLAAEKLHEHQNCLVSRETPRKWMIEDGLWIDRRRRLPSVHQPRNRRERIGELIQIDGSKHHWFENRGPACSLIAYLDDATSRILHVAFVPSESTLHYLRETRTYVGAPWSPDRVLFGQARDFPRKQPRGQGRRRYDTIWSGPARAQHRHHLRQHPTSQGSR